MAKDDPQTVTEFAVQQGTVDPDAPGVQDAIDADRDRAEENTQRARELSELLTGPESGVPENDGEDTDA